MLYFKAIIISIKADGSDSQIPVNPINSDGLEAKSVENPRHRQLTS